MPLSGTPGPCKRKKSSRIITDLSHIAQDEYQSEPDASEFDLGTKISIPQDIMLEELSLLKNKGSKMFKLRKQRVERFIYENNPDIFSQESMDNFQKLMPGLGGKMINVGGHMIGGHMVGGHMIGGHMVGGHMVGGHMVGGHMVGGHMVGGRMVGYGGNGPIPPPRPGSHGKGAGAGAGGHAGAGGEGGEHSAAGDHAGSSAQDKKSLEYVKTYISPWERAMKGNKELTATMRLYMPGPGVHGDLPKYKSFNRSAMPYGGFQKASQLMTFQLPDVTTSPEEPELSIVYQYDINSRPTFNRTPIGWVGSGDTSHVHLEMEIMPFDGETDDL